MWKRFHGAVDDTEQYALFAAQDMIGHISPVADPQVASYLSDCSDRAHWRQLPWYGHNDSTGESVHRTLALLSINGLGWQGTPTALARLTQLQKAGPKLREAANLEEALARCRAIRGKGMQAYIDSLDQSHSGGSR